MGDGCKYLWLIFAGIDVDMDTNFASENLHICGFPLYIFRFPHLLIRISAGIFAATDVEVDKKIIFYIGTGLYPEELHTASLVANSPFIQAGLTTEIVQTILRESPK